MTEPPFKKTEIARAIELRDYQEQGFGEIRVAFRNDLSPVLYVLPTGGGKTYTFSAIAASAADKGRRVIIIVHRKELLLQASASLTNLGIEHGLISPFFTPDPHRLVQVASVDTLVIRLKKYLAGGKVPAWLRFDLVIFDEAHHVVDGNKWGRAFDMLTKAHGGENPKPPKMLGVTATPVRTDGKGLGDHAGGVFKSMVLGPSVAELIARGMLINPEVYTSLEQPDVSDLKTNKEGDYNLQELAAKVDKPRITGDTVNEYSRICPGAKAIAFCASIEHCKHVRDAFNAAGYRFELLVGSPEMSDTERTAVNKRLRRGDIDGACTVELVSEGYDLPDLEACIMLRPTASEALFLQQAGRIMRPSDAKRGCWLLDQVGNVGRMIDGVFKRKHGLPSQEREWTLDGRKKKKKGKKEQAEEVIDLKQCQNCFVVQAPAMQCVACGFQFPTTGKKPPEQVDGKLEKITDDIAIQALEQKRVQASSKTVEDLVNRLGYSEGRAKKIVAARAEKDGLRNGLKDDLLAWRTETGKQPIEVIGMYISDMQQLKPKALKELRDAFDRHREAWRSAVARGDDPEFATELVKIINPAASMPLL